MFRLEKNYLINSLQLEQYRGLNHVLIDDFSRVNIFVGANNCGKTSVLEALKILSVPNSAGQLVEIALQRARAGTAVKKSNLINYLTTIFQKPQDGSESGSYHLNLGIQVQGRSHQYDVTGTLGRIVDSAGRSEDIFNLIFRKTIDGEDFDYSDFQIINGQEYTFSSDISPLYRALYVPASVNYYRSCVKFLSKQIIRTGKKDVMQILKTFDENIDDISIIGEDIYLHSTYANSMALFAYGAGMQKAVFLAACLMYCKDGVILVDEIDNAIHISAFEAVFDWFLEACRNWNVQAFVTTHSAEAIDSIIKTAHDRYRDEDILRVITLRKNYDTNKTVAKIRSGDDAYQDRTCFEMELRV